LKSIECIYIYHYISYIGDIQKWWDNLIGTTVNDRWFNQLLDRFSSLQ
jgi:hypothetical protein